MAILSSPSSPTHINTLKSGLSSVVEFGGSYATRFAYFAPEAVRAVSSTALKVFGTISVITAISFAAIDLYGIVMNWNSVHPTIGMIMKLKAELFEEIKRCQKNIEIIRRLINEEMTRNVSELRTEVEQLRTSKERYEAKISELNNKLTDNEMKFIMVNERLNNLESNIHY